MIYGKKSPRECAARVAVLFLRARGEAGKPARELLQAKLLLFRDVQKARAFSPRVTL